MTISQVQIDNLIEVVRTAGRLNIMPYFRNLSPQSVQTKLNAKDLVTDADRAAELAIAAAVAKILPDAVIVGEEAVAEQPNILKAIGKAETTVIIDPIDGTSNFVSGLAVFGTILSVVRNGETIFGLLYDPVSDDWIYGIHGGGAYYASDEITPRLIAPRSARPFSEAKGFLPLDSYSPADRSASVRAFESVYQIHDIRCSCHEYRLLASGHADFLRSCTLNPWDHAAGVLVLQEVGGWARVEGVAPYTPMLTSGNMLAASCAEVGERVRGLIVGRLT